MGQSPVPSRVVVTRDGASLFDIVPTGTDLFQGVVFAAPCQLAQYGHSAYRGSRGHRGEKLVSREKLVSVRFSRGENRTDTNFGRGKTELTPISAAAL